MDIGWEVGLPSSGDGNAGNRFRRYGRVCAEEAEYSRAIHCNATNSGPLIIDSKDYRGVGKYRMVVTEGPGPGRI